MKGLQNRSGSIPNRLLISEKVIYVAREERKEAIASEQPSLKNVEAWTILLFKIIVMLVFWHHYQRVLKIRLADSSFPKPYLVQGARGDAACEVSVKLSEGC